MARCFRAWRPVTAWLAALTVLVAVAAPVAASPAEDPIIDGLAGPLGLAIGRNGTVFVTEAFAGRLTAVRPDGEIRVVLDEPGTELAGVDAKWRHRLVVTQTIFDGNAGEEAPPLDGVLVRVRRDGSKVTLASLQDFEASTNPDSVNEYGLVDPSVECLYQWPEYPPPTYTGIVESHPYAVATVRRGYVVADAAANAIFRLTRRGHLSTIAVLPPVEQMITAEVVAQIGEEGIDISDCEGTMYRGEPVPTDIEVGKDGYFYVSTLPGFPELPGSGSVWKIKRGTWELTQVATGLSGPVDIAVAADGTIWVAELFGSQISTITNGVVTPYMSVDTPGAIEIGRDGSVYATTGVFGPSGAVIRVSP